MATRFKVQVCNNHLFHYLYIITQQLINENIWIFQEQTAIFRVRSNISNARFRNKENKSVKRMIHIFL